MSCRTAGIFAIGQATNTAKRPSFVGKEKMTRLPRMWMPSSAIGTALQ
jgi:hypothetical protein